MRREWLVFGGVGVIVLVIGLMVASGRWRRASPAEQEHLTAEQMTADPNQAAEDAAAAAVERLGGTVARDKGSPHIVRVSLRDRPVTDADLKELQSLVWTRSLDLSGTRVTDAGLRELRPLTLLVQMDLSRTGVTGSGLADLAGVVRLNDLNLAESKASDSGLAGLAGFSTLRTLDLSGTAVSDAGLDRLKPVTALETLKLARTGVTDAGVATLQSLATLETVNLAHTRITGKSVPVLSSLGLRTLDVSGVPLTADELTALRRARARPAPEIPRPGGPMPTTKPRDETLKVIASVRSGPTRWGRRWS